MQLISLPVSPFAARVRIAILAKGLAVDIEPPPAGWPNNPQFRDISPTGRVPVLLLDDGGALWEAAVILEFLEEAFPTRRPLLPADVHERARARIFVRHVDSYLMPPMSALADPRHAPDEGRRHAEALIDALGVLDGLLDGGPYAVGEALTIADCALAPALFAAQVTAGRLDFSLADVVPQVAAYARRIVDDVHVREVLGEMEDGLKRLTAAAGSQPPR